MLTNKEIIKSLSSVGYTLQEISKWTGIDIKTLRAMKKGEDVNEEVETSLNNFFRMNIEEVKISKFEDKEYRKNHLILTPEGFKKCNSYKDSGKQNCIKINFNSFSTVVVPDSKLQLDNDKWVVAKKLKARDMLKVFDSEDEIISIETINDIDCCDINIDGNYYNDGIILD